MVIRAVDSTAQVVRTSNLLPVHPLTGRFAPETSAGDVSSDIRSADIKDPEVVNPPPSLNGLHLPQLAGPQQPITSGVEEWQSWAIQPIELQQPTTTGGEQLPCTWQPAGLQQPSSVRIEEGEHEYQCNETNTDLLLFTLNVHPHHCLGLRLGIESKCQRKKNSSQRGWLTEYKDLLQLISLRSKEVLQGRCVVTSKHMKHNQPCMHAHALHFD